MQAGLLLGSLIKTVKGVNKINVKVRVHMLSSAYSRQGNLRFSRDIENDSPSLNPLHSEQTPTPHLGLFTIATKVAPGLYTIIHFVDE